MTQCRFEPLGVTLEPARHRLYLRTCNPVLDLAGVEALLVGVLHAGKHSRATETHWVDGALIVEQHPVRDDLRGPRQSWLKTLL